jgi:hypothetical protein
MIQNQLSYSLSGIFREKSAMLYVVYRACLQHIDSAYQSKFNMIEVLKCEDEIDVKKVT